jgi:hypothetical protein
MKVFIIAANSPTPFQRNAITNSYQNTQYGFWHWTPDFWILKSPYDWDTSESIRNTLHKLPLLQTLSFIVLGVEPREGDWAGWGPQEWSQWLNENWKKSTPPFVNVLRGIPKV